MQRYIVFAALLCLMPMGAQAGDGAPAPKPETNTSQSSTPESGTPESGTPESGTPASPVAFSLKAQPPVIDLTRNQWTMPSDVKAPLNPDKTGKFVEKMLTVGDNMHLEPSGQSDIDVKPTQGQKSDRGAYLNLKIDW